MSRKPPQWMRRFAPEGNPAHLFPVVCSCGRWIFSERDVVWQSWDAGIIEGDDLVTAIILDRPLIRIRHVSHMDIVRLETVAGPLGISPDGQYLGAHEWRPDARQRQASGSGRQRIPLFDASWFSENTAGARAILTRGPDCR